MNSVVESVGLSTNPQAQVVDFPNGINNKLNVITKEGSSKGCHYFVMNIVNKTNPERAVRRTLVCRQTRNAAGNLVWSGLTPNEALAQVGRVVEQTEVVSRQVPPYVVNGNTTTKYSTIMLAGETVESLFKTKGHELIQQVSSEVQAKLDPSSLIGSK